MKNLYKKEIFESCVLKKFENTELPVPIGYDEYLKTAFGNYMQLPPEHERVNLHDIIFLDLNNSCEKYKNRFWFISLQLKKTDIFSGVAGKSLEFRYTL